MANTSQMHRNFVKDPVGDKDVTDLAGIGSALGDKLIDAGFVKAYQVVGQYLVLRKDKKRFCEWLKDTTNANRNQQNACHDCVKEWCDKFVA